MPTLSVPPAVARLSDERPAVRWIILGCVWLLVLALALADTIAVRDYVALLDDSGTLPADSLPLQRPLPAPYADAQTWTRLALAADTNGTWQVRHTDIDNAPAGRDVHWSSALVHVIALSGRLRAAATHEPVPLATERALAWINLPLLVALIVFFSSWVAARAGAAAGVLVALGMIGHRWFYDGFAPNYVDHHGLLTAASFGCVLGAMFFSGAPHDAPSSGRSAALLSAICGGFGLWISAASVLPTVAVVGVAGAIAALLRDSADTSSAQANAELWRLWSRLGAAISVVAYLIEYAPSHLGMRLEVNHPLYALAWLGGGEIVAWILERRQRRINAPPWRLAVAVVLVALPVVVLGIGGSRFFLPLDPTVARLHSHIDEFGSLFGMARRLGAPFLTRYVLSFLLLLPALLAFRKGPRRANVAFVAIATVALTALGFWQIRWWLPASGAELCLLVVALATVSGSWSSRTRWAVVAIIGAVFIEQSVARTALTRHNVSEAAVTEADAMQPLYRDVAVALRHSQPTGTITLLSSPDASLAVSYFGGFRSIGTFYWENRDGLKAAAGMFDALSDDEALAKLGERRVTHVALFSADNFLQPYLAAIQPHATSDDLRRTFGSRLLFQGHVPRWLRAIPYLPRAGSPSKRVLLFQVAPEQTEPDALWSQGIALAASGDDSGATGVIEQAIAMAPLAQRARLLADAARETYRWRAHRASLTLFEAALALEHSPATTLAIAWLLSTSPDDGVRNGARAVALTEPLARANPEAGGVLDTYAAALAEAGRFDDAIRAEAAAVDNAKRQGDATAVARATDRLRSYQSGRPWRQ
jgi:tetratricopeptide (TPR) repeat protein